MFGFNSETSRFKRALKEASRLDWKLTKQKSKELVDLAVQLHFVDEDRADKLRNKLQYGAVYLREDGQWACTTCGGNCGQCGDTGFYGNIGFSMDHIVGRINGVKIPGRSRASPWLFVKRQLKFVLFIISWLVWLGTIAIVSWFVSKLMYG